MGLLAELFEAAANLAGIIGILTLIVAIVTGVAFLGIFSIVGVGIPVEIFTHDKNERFLHHRMLLVIALAIGLFLIRWYLPFAICAAAGVVALLIEVGTSGR
ncbi:MAG: hypothetical protein WB561_05430 [Terracidiphilus sp.]